MVSIQNRFWLVGRAYVLGYHFKELDKLSKIYFILKSRVKSISSDLCIQNISVYHKGPNPVPNFHVFEASLWKKHFKPYNRSGHFILYLGDIVYFHHGSLTG